MNKRYFFFCFAIVAICITVITACKKENDYRDQWVGEWKFTTYDYTQSGFSGEPLTIKRDTIHFIGSIGKYETNKLKIVFKPNATEPDLGNHFPLSINGLLYPTIDDSGILTIFGLDCRPYFQGFIFNNEISISYGMIGPLGMAAHENHQIQGTKIK